MTLDQAVERIADLESEVSYWKAEAEAHARLDAGDLLQEKLGLSPQQAFIVAELLRVYPKIVSGWNLMDKIPSRFRLLDEPRQNCVKVHVHKIRRKIGETSVRTLWGRGYAIGGDAWADYFRTMST